MSERTRFAGLVTLNQTEVLKTLYDLRKKLGAHTYWRPSHLGSSKNSHHGVTLQRLVERGLVERIPHHDETVRSFKYRMSDRGAELWEELVEMSKMPMHTLLGPPSVRERVVQMNLLMAA